MTFTFMLNLQKYRWKILKGFSGDIVTNWGWEVNFYATHSVILVDSRITLHGDHRGFFVMLGLFSYAVDLNIYDNRHQGEY